MKIKIPFLMLAALAGLGVSIRSSPQERPAFWEEFDSAFPDAFHAYKPGEDPKVKMIGPQRMIAGAYGEWTFDFVAGSQSVKSGGALAIAMRHVSGWGGTPQTFDPGGPDYVSIRTPTGVGVELHGPPDPFNRFSVPKGYLFEYFPWQHMITVEITRGQPLPGKSIQLIFGDRSRGSPGFRAPSVAREHALFLALVRRDAGGQFVPIPEHLSVSILPKVAVRLNLVAPSDAVVRSPVRVLLRAEDEEGNVAADYRGTVSLKVEGGASDVLASYTFQAADRGIHILPEIRFTSPGTYFIQAVDPDAGFRAESNPIRCSATPRPLKVLWGDFHDHSVISDGTGSPSHAFRYARDVAGLDFFALTDHGYMINQTSWQLIQRIVTEFNDPPHFVTFYGYEWSGYADVGGDHNVIYAQPGMPLYRESSYYEPKNPFIYSGPDLGAAHIVQLYKRLRLVAAEKNARILVIPHFRGRPANPQWNDSEFSPVIELASEAGWHENWALEFLRRGYRMGFIGSSDDHYGRPGYGMADNPMTGYGAPLEGGPIGQGNRFHYPWGVDVQGSPLVGVLATENSRESIFQAFFSRHCYVTSGARIILDFHADGHEMGDEFTAAGPPRFEAATESAVPIVSVILKKDGKPLFTQGARDGARSAWLSYTEPRDYQGHFYYVEVVTVDPQERALSSPIWID